MSSMVLWQGTLKEGLTKLTLEPHLDCFEFLPLLFSTVTLWQVSQ